MKSTRWALEKVDYPGIEPFEDTAGEAPVLDAGEYERRLEAVRDRMGEEGLDTLVVYGDREHAANVQYLAGVDPRFEEVIAVVPKEGEAALLLGNEDWGYADMSPAGGFRKELYQTLSLMHQHRDRSVDLEAVLARCGVRKGSRVGVAGWKYFEPHEFSDPAHTLEVPSFVVDTLRDMAGFLEVVNAGHIFMHPERGLRAVNSAAQLAVFEFNAAQLTRGILGMIRDLRPGMSEQEAFGRMRCAAAPYSVHPMFTTGERALASGLNSPSTRRIERGDPIATAVGVWGALSARAGYVEDADSALRDGPMREYLERVVFPYREMISLWYGSVEIGRRGWKLYDDIERASRESGIPLMLNPGHSIHYDEWMNSPFYKGSTHAVRSGMLLQCDLIPVVSGGFGSNVEDTVAVCDERLRGEIERTYPRMWARVQARRRFMTDVLGYTICAEIMPFSDISGALAPFFLSPDMVVVQHS